jgi:DNA invertase Pin-like site-specific DNA recombinase
MNAQSLNHKLSHEQLARKAIVYLRQSSERQVLHNRESQHLQYALAERARSFGFTDVEIIDCDLGSSAAVGAAARIGFERLLAQVALGEVGLILSREVSRLSRTDKDWCQLLELCQLFDTFIADHEQIYDLNTIDDQLILGIKGTMSVVELKVLRMRMWQGMEEKARRGALIRVAPAGYVLDLDGKVVKNPDLRVREAIDLIFRRFQEAWSVQGTINWFRRQGVDVPVNKPKAGGGYGIFWQLPSASFIGHVLRNPFYAGAYFYGQRQTKIVLVDGKPVKRRGPRRPPEECRVFIRNHHEGYITWQEHLEIMATIEKNAIRVEGRDPVAAVRNGRALLAGLVRCGICGRRLDVHYAHRHTANSGCAYYRCRGTRPFGGARCTQLSAARADKIISTEVLRAISPLGVAAALRATQALASRKGDQRCALDRQLEECEYQAARAFEQYNQADPRHRLVAAELERRWNEKLQEIISLKARITDIEREASILTAEDRTTLLELGHSFAETWEALRAPEMKKKILRSVIEEVIAIPDAEKQTLRFVLHWKGGVHTSVDVPMPRPHDVHRTSLSDLDLIQKMAASGREDEEIARVLGAQGRRTGKGHPWTAISVGTARRNYHIPGCKQSTPDPSVLSLNAAAKYCGVSNTAIKALVRSGMLACNQVAACAPWEIRREDLDSKPIRDAIEALQRTGKLTTAGTNSRQKTFDLE